ncbi:MAG TPA: hypothetical protein VGS41_17105 [Chthonomonadales bacterium]|nr:hypothetical protein [Chthonomonadales bacterium]
MQPVSPKDVRLDRTVLAVSKLTDEDLDLDYWAEATPEERLRYMELLRRVNYGRRAAGRLQRVLSVAKLK